MSDTTYVCQVCGIDVDRARAEKLIERDIYWHPLDHHPILCEECAAIDTNPHAAEEA